MRSRAMRMATRRYLWDRMKVSLWFVPLIMALGAIVLSWLLGWLDAQLPNAWFDNSKLVLSGSAAELRSIMVNVAGTVLATAGVVFSLLTLPLSTVATQYGSRLLRIFMRDRTTQLVLGSFVATFCYCLATALSIPNTQAEFPAPQITVTFGLLLMLVTFASLIILIQHISTMLQAPNIIAAAGDDLRALVEMETTVEAMDNQVGTSERVAESLVDDQAYPLLTGNSGYIQVLDLKIILNLAFDKDLIIRLLRQPGQFVRTGEVAALIWPASHVDESLARHLRRAFQVGNQRTPTQDFEYAINQLVEISVRAMSPAINDPFTAITCLDHLADGLEKYVQLGEISPYIVDDAGALRLIYEPASLFELLNSAFNMLRHASCDNATVLLHMLDTIGVIGRSVKSPEVRQELIRHIHLVLAESRVGALIEPDQRRIRQRCEALELTINTRGN